ncbi:predicted protein [Botrytis cinerea T4]|uniref:Uncharacterized protein n=1 Tax=Botryotinia fuckeliana (strain T4) TaxID=999810 RepID=G2YNH5_BOTF4|nr:predicted protein [Botrytis cinerea T4]
MCVQFGDEKLQLEEDVFDMGFNHFHIQVIESPKNLSGRPFHGENG